MGYSGPIVLCFSGKEFFFVFRGEIFGFLALISGPSDLMFWCFCEIGAFLLVCLVGGRFLFSGTKFRLSGTCFVLCVSGISFSLCLLRGNVWLSGTDFTLFDMGFSCVFLGLVFMGPSGLVFGEIGLRCMVFIIEPFG